MWGYDPKIHKTHSSGNILWGMFRNDPGGGPHYSVTRLRPEAGRDPTRSDRPPTGLKPGVIPRPGGQEGRL